MSFIQKLKVNQLASVFRGVGDTEHLRSRHSLVDWNMERDDAPILAQIIHRIHPCRHLEFGTWKGFGACLVMENSPATVWTINLLSGENRPDGSWAYSERLAEGDTKKNNAPTISFGQDKAGEQTYYQTDAGAAIGQLYRERGLGHRVNQIYCDSRSWDTAAYPKGFFDTIFIDGGHQTDVVASDTKKAIPLLRQGGVVLWHDYCLNEAVKKKYPHVVSVIKGVDSVSKELSQAGIDLYWIDPSWLLLGIKKPS